MILFCSVVGFFDDSSVGSVVEEILKMKDLSHPNVLTLMGVALDARLSPCLIMPYMCNGSLCEYLRKEVVRSELLLSNKVEPVTVVR